MFFKKILCFILLAGPILASDDRSRDNILEEMGQQGGKKYEEPEQLENQDNGGVNIIIKEIPKSSSHVSLTLVPSNGQYTPSRSDRCEAFYWDKSACCYRITGGMFETAGFFAFIISNALIPILAVILPCDQSAIAAAILAGINFLVIFAPTIMKTANKIANERENFAQDIIKTGRVDPKDISTPNYGPGG